MLSRRTFNQALISSPLLTLPIAGIADQVSPTQQDKSLNFLLEKKSSIVLSEATKKKLTQAVLDFLEDNYKGMSLRFWQRPFEEIDFEKRINLIIHWLDIAIQQYQLVYPVDPIWALAQIKAESLFCELAISDSLAAGICQFMPSTATKGYQMIVAGSQDAHKHPPYLNTDLADSLDKYRAIVKERNQYRKSTRSLGHFDLQKALTWIAQNKGGKKQARQQLKRLEKIKQYNQQISQASKDYVTYMESNISALGNNDIFQKPEFFAAFDERFTYQKPIFAMTHMLANALRVRNGNVLTASAAYNAGLGRTWTSEAIYREYGFIPNIEETSVYVSRIVANYEEISKRFYG